MAAGRSGKGSLSAWMAYVNATMPMNAGSPGFATSYPMNWWLIRPGIKTEM